MSYEIDDTSVPPRWLDLRACMLSGQMSDKQINAEMTADPGFAAWLRAETAATATRERVT